MKRTALNTFSILFAVTALAPVALAGDVATKNQTRLTRAEYTPASLVNAAYNDRLPGIPAFGSLEAEVSDGDLDAKDLVAAGIAQGRLTEAHLSDRGSLNAVEANLDGLASSN